MKYTKLIIKIFIVVIAIATIVLNSLYFAPHKLTIREETIKSNKISKDLNGFIIAYFSDLHYGTYTNVNDLDKVVSTINSVAPDVVIFGGDLIDKKTNVDGKELINKLSSIKATNNKYAVFGEHDTYNESIKTRVENIFTKSGFVVLDNDNQQIYKDYSNDYFNIIGINSVDKDSLDLTNVFENVTNNNFTFVITHYPDSFDNIKKYDADYVLAGHSHGPQIYVPLFNLFYREDGYEKYIRGKHRDNNCVLDITTGVGLTNKSIRLFSDAEVVFYKLISTN